LARPSEQSSLVCGYLKQEWRPASPACRVGGACSRDVDLVLQDFEDVSAGLRPAVSDLRAFSDVSWKRFPETAGSGIRTATHPSLAKT